MMHVLFSLSEELTLQIFCKYNVLTNLVYSIGVHHGMTDNVFLHLTRTTSSLWFNSLLVVSHRIEDLLIILVVLEPHAEYHNMEVPAL